MRSTWLAASLGKISSPKDTQKFGVEALRDNNNELGLYVSQTGKPGRSSPRGLRGWRAPVAPNSSGRNG